MRRARARSSRIRSSHARPAHLACLLGAGAFAALGAGTVQAAPVSAHVMVQNTIGCLSWSDYESLTTIARSGNEEAFVRRASPLVARGQCIAFKAGDDVTLEEEVAVQRASCVKPEWKTACYWIPIDASKPAH